MRWFFYSLISSKIAQKSKVYQYEQRNYSISYVTKSNNQEWQDISISNKALCPNLICRNPRVKVLFGYRKNTYQRQTDRFLIRNTEDDDVIKNGSRPDGVEPRPSATPKYDMYMAGAQMAGAQIKRAQITSKTNRWLHQPFVYYRFSLQFILLVVFDREDTLSVQGIPLLFLQKYNSKS